MRRRVAILTAGTLAVLALGLAFNGGWLERPTPPLPPEEDGATDVVDLDPGVVSAPGAPPGVRPETESPDVAPVDGPGRALRGELVILDGATGLEVRTEPIAFSRRSFSAAKHVPTPWIAGAKALEFAEPQSALAERVRLTAVVWPELDLTLRVENADGTPAPSAVVIRAVLGGRNRPFRAVRIGASEEFRIEGLPWMRQEIVSLYLGSDRWIEATGLLPEDPVRMRIRLPAAVDPVIKDSKVSDHNETDNDLPFEESLGSYISPSAPAKIKVRVLHADGTPAVRVLVQGYFPTKRRGLEPDPVAAGRTDADGIAQIRIGELSKLHVAVREPGFLFGDPVPADSAETVLREAPGADLDVLVVDGENRPLPGAKIEVDLPHWAWLERGVQRVGLFTGPDGSIRLPRLPLQDVTIRARYGERRAKVVARPPGRTEIRLPRKL